LSDHPDIYTELLGIPPGARPPDFYRLLGIAPFEPDPVRISAATKRQVTRLSHLLNGSRAEQVQRLIAEIATARAALTTPEVKERYDAKLRKQPDAPWYTVVPDVPAASSDPSAPPPPTLPTVSPAEPVGGRVPVDAIDPAFVKETKIWPCAEPVLSEPELDSDRPLRWAHQVAAPPPLPDLPVGAPTVAKARLVSGPGTAFSSVTTPCTPPQPTAMAPGMPLANVPPAAPWPQEAIPTTPTALGAPIGTDGYAPLRRPNFRRRDSSQVALIVALVCIVGLVALFGGALVVRQSSAPIVAQDGDTVAETPRSREKDSPTHARAGRDDQPRRSSDAGTSTARGQKAEDPRSEPKRAKNDRDVIHPAKSAGSAMKDAAPPARKPAAPADNARAEPVRQSIKAARKALAARDLAAAEEQIDLALVDASSDALRAEIDGEKALHHYIERFWNAVRESAKTLDTGHEFEVDGRTVIVVEISRDKKKLVLRSKGQNRDYTIEDLPADVAAGLAERWLAKDDVNSKVFVGAFLAIDAQGNRERGRRLLSEAKARGSDAAATVLAELDR
jgi:hypothetical protein